MDDHAQRGPAPPYGIPRAGSFDGAAFERAIGDLLKACGIAGDTVHTGKTGQRVRELWQKRLLGGYDIDPAAALGEGFDDERQDMVVIRGIAIHGVCPHHLVPFRGVAHVGYLPGERIVGLSKLARVVELFARSLQVQERLTTQIAGWLEHELSPKGVGVVLEAEHSCMTIRGVQKAGAHTVTSAMRGKLRDDPRTRAEFLALAGGRA